MNSFFQPGAFLCPIYCRTRDGRDKHHSEGREFLEMLWRDYSAFLDPDIRQRATLNMPAVFWELYVAHALHSSGIHLQPQTRTKQNKKGPDLFAVDPDVWIEAVMPDMGTGPDAMQPQELGIAYEVPVNAFILRARNAFATKAHLMTEYAHAGIIQPQHATVIAIGGGLIASIGDGIPPQIVRALLGVGSPVLHIDPTTLTTVDHSIEHRDGVTKKSGFIVKTDPFLDPAYAHVSAVIYSACNWVSHPEKPGIDFTVVYNENANVSLPRGWLPAAKEYWREERGTYVSASPGGGLNFRQRIDVQSPNAAFPPPPVSNTSTPMQQIASEDAGGMVAHGAILERINANERRAAWLPWVGVLIAGILTVSFSLVGFYIGCACVGLCFWIRAYLRSASPVELEYQFNDEDKSRSDTLRGALASLGQSRRLWQINAFGDTADWKRNAGANRIIDRAAAQVGQGTPRSFRCNIEVFTLKLAKETLYFLPDMVFVQQGKTFGSVSYPSITVANSVTRFNETEGVPADSQQVGTTWRYVNKNGGPDRRFNNNHQIPIALYGQLAMQSDSGLRVALMTSSTDAAIAFASSMRIVQQSVPKQMLYLSAPE